MTKRLGNVAAYNSYQREWRSANKEHCSEWERSRYVNDPRVREQKIANAKQYQRGHVEQKRAYNRQYYLDNYEKFTAANLARHSRQPMDKDLVLQIFEEENYTCAYCNVRGGKLTIDHKMPVSRGGSNDRSNLCVACRTCNCSKGAKTPGEFAAYMQEISC